ncbi:late control protein [Mesorhizobium sp. M2A.F.Ca.ET.039.01.1.1]|uniref:phage late control D family protein n=1 Tax=Mesorhizobium sp. M2A.F.Ca.ET.039.01.1.1 TaxID=2496746 RepID=UPI000FCA08E8|nr:late control protein [Mesorhizobium sp. M2A.F.Ca.ET.039.01.1.1]RWX72610.1 late control protein [Mesorhizobium sp. M2A.F.Ca.ET.039.01.1.1]
MTKRAIYSVSVAGQDISSRIAPILLSLRISDKEGTHSDTASIELDDSSGMIRFPKTGAPMSVAIGWEGEGFSVVFEGTVDEVKSSGSRGGGRTLSISGKGVDTQGKAKEAQQLHVDNADVKTALSKAGEIAGITDIKVDPSLASIKREWWGLNDESFLHFGERIAREVGGIFKIRGKRAILAAKTGGSPSGAALASVNAAWGDNLISWDITPAMGRPRHKKVRARFYDKKGAKWKQVEAEVEDEDAEAIFGDRQSRADEDEAKASSDSQAKDAEKQKGGGTVQIDGTASAVPGGTLNLIGARPGIDGAYRIESVDHDYSRSGWTTSCELKQPKGSAGKDTRKVTKTNDSGGDDDGGDVSLPRDPDLG